MTLLLFREDAYRRVASATVTSAEPGAVMLDATVFYPRGGGQPGDVGALTSLDGQTVPVLDTMWASDRATVLHRVAVDHSATWPPGVRVMAELDWPRRYALMRIHTALHLLTTVLPYPVTGGSIGEGEGRLDFDMPDGTDRTAIEAALNERIGRDLPVMTRWISDDELLASPGLVKTLSVKPPIGSGRVRLVAIGDLDLQPCGGTHVASTAEIGAVVVTGIENKGKQNRRVRIALAEVAR